MTGRLYNTKQVSEMLGIHIHTVRDYVNAGKLDAHNVGGFKITEESLERFLKQTKVQPEVEAVEA